MLQVRSGFTPRERPAAPAAPQVEATPMPVPAAVATTAATTTAAAPTMPMPTTSTTTAPQRSKRAGKRTGKRATRGEYFADDYEPRRRLTPEERAERAREALQRATCQQVVTNYGAIFEGFTAKGIPQDEIRPRENVFTFNAWKALHRHVRKGEHGVKVISWVPTTRTTDDGTEETAKMPITAVVFHVSQTEPDAS